MQIQVDGESTYIYTGSRAFVAEQPSIVFVHGGGLDHTVWVLQSRYFAHHGFNALAMDLPGHGRSTGTPPDSIEGYADWIVRFLDALDIADASVTGHSMGSLVALEAAARHCDRVTCLGLIGTATPMPVADILLDAAEANEHAAFDMINIWGHTIGQIGGHRAPGMWMMGGAVRLLERASPGVLYNDLKACNDYELGQSGKRVKCRTSLILGELDMMSPPKRAQTIADDIADRHIVIVPECGHMLMAERPDEVLEALVELTEPFIINKPYNKVNV